VEVTLPGEAIRIGHGPMITLRPLADPRERRCVLLASTQADSRLPQHRDGAHTADWPGSLLVRDVAW